MFWFTVFAIVCCWLLYYYFVIVKQNSKDIICADTVLNRELLRRCPQLTAPFQPTIWGVHRHVQTVFNVMLRKSVPVKYKRELVHLLDGGHVGLDWCEDNEHVLTLETPTVLVIPGLTGGSHELEIRAVVGYIRDNAYRVVVFNYRGCSGLKLTSPLNTVSLADLEAAIDRITERFPRSPLFAIGYSMGSNILSLYLGKTGTDSKILGGVSVSNPFDLSQCSDALNGSPFNRRAYQRHFLNNRKRMIQSHKEVFDKVEGLDFRRIFSADNIREFDEAVTKVVYRASSAKELHDSHSSRHYIDGIQVPLLFLNALDDPLLYSSQTIPYDSIKANPMCLLKVTQHGGHVAFLDGLLPLGPSWCDRVCVEFINALLAVWQAEAMWKKRSGHCD